MMEIMEIALCEEKVTQQSNIFISRDIF